MSTARCPVARGEARDFAADYSSAWPSTATHSAACAARGWSFALHRTDRPASQALLALRMRLRAGRRRPPGGALMFGLPLAFSAPRPRRPRSPCRALWYLLRITPPRAAPDRLSAAAADSRPEAARTRRRPRRPGRCWCCASRSPPWPPGHGRADLEFAAARRRRRAVLLVARRRLGGGADLGRGASPPPPAYRRRQRAGTAVAADARPKARRRRNRRMAPGPRASARGAAKAVAAGSRRRRRSGQSSRAPIKPAPRLDRRRYRAGRQRPLRRRPARGGGDGRCVEVLTDDVAPLALEGADNESGALDVSVLRAGRGEAA